MKPEKEVALAAAQAWVHARSMDHQKAGLEPQAATQKAIDEFQAAFPDYPRGLGKRAHLSISYVH